MSARLPIALLLLALATSGALGQDAQPSEIRIGYFGPSDADDPDGGDLWLAAKMAIDEANASGGHDGLPYRLVPSWSGDPWSSGAADLARSVYGERVWAILGSIDGASTHLAETIVAKARVLLLSPGSTDKTVNLANVPWVFSCLPPDNALARLLTDAIAQRGGGRAPLLISATDHDSHAAVQALLGALGDVGLIPTSHFEFDPDSQEIESLVARALDEEPGALVVVAPTRASARIVSGLRAAGHDGPLFGWTAMSRRGFVESAGAAAEGVLFPLPCDPSFADSDFSGEFSRRHGRPPDCTTVQTYDATRLLIETLERSGLDRTLVRDTLRANSPWSGAAGRIEWGPLGQNLREPALGSIREGRVTGAR